VNATRQLRRQSFDLVNLQGCCALAGDVVTAHSCHRSYWQLRRKLPARLRKWLNPFHYVALYLSDRLFTSRHTRWVIALSQGIEQDLCDIYGFPPQRILVRTPGVDRDQFHPANRVRYRPEVRAKFDLGEDDFVLLFVGNEFHRKGLDLVLQAMARISQPRLKLLVAGATHPAVQWQYRRLARRLGVQVRFAGRQRNMERIYAAADVFVLPSLYEAFPAVVLEAAASGLPLLGSRANGIRDVLIHDRNGWYVERDPADIAARITALMDHPQQSSCMGMAARASTVDFDANRARASLLSTYKSLAKNGLPATAQASQECEAQQPEQPHALF
jgi:UDP-glucose:(heptosyl)LPS alpha-1,3-glucosyltransferase